MQVGRVCEVLYFLPTHGTLKAPTLCILFGKIIMILSTPGEPVELDRRPQSLIEVVLISVFSALDVRRIPEASGRHDVAVTIEELPRVGRAFEKNYRALRVYFLKQ